MGCDDVDGISSSSCVLLSQKLMGDDIDGCRNRCISVFSGAITISSNTSSESLAISKDFTPCMLNVYILNIEYELKTNYFRNSSFKE